MVPPVFGNSHFELVLGSFDIPLGGGAMRVYG